MDLKEVLTALQAVKTEQYPEGIIVAVDLGVHQYCLIESNCPRAVQLRKVLSDAGISLAELLEAHNSNVQSVQSPIDYTVPEFDSNIQVRIAGKEITLNINDVLEEELRIEVQNKLGVLNHLRHQLENMGLNLHKTYTTEIRKVRSSFVLPQLRIDAADLLENRCITSAVNNSYSYTLPLVYKPQYIVKTGIRLKMGDRDIESLRQDIFVRYIMTNEDAFYSITLVNVHGRKFEHYHGRSTDCWGQVKIPKKWDGRIKSLASLTRLLEVSLVTIDANSLVSQIPLDMPHIQDLIDNSTELGVEGALPEEVQEVREGDEERIAPTTFAPIADGVPDGGRRDRDNRWGGARRE